VDLALDGWQLAVVHGNGPQVGDELVRNELARAHVEPLPLGVLVAATAGWIGYMIQQSLDNALRRAGLNRSVTTIVTQVEVDPTDKALVNPSKFIGHAIPAERARALIAEGHPVKKDSNGLYRRVVGSPVPLGIHDMEIIKALVENGTIVIACGGGGVPVYTDSRGNLEGVDAIIDKDAVAAVLAAELNAELLLILTSVDAVYADWGTQSKRAISELSISEAQTLDAAKAFGEGSMAPKVRAAVDFVSKTGGRAIIAELNQGMEAVHGRAGTTVAR
jgi:carbamate kinase